MTNTSWWNQTSTTTLITRCCVVSMSECTLRRCISDCAHTLPALLCIRDVLEPSLSYALYQTRMVILNFDAWCSIMKNITTSLRIWATDVYCVILNPALEYRHSTGQYWYMSLPGPNAAHIYIYIYIYTEQLSQHKFWSKGIWVPDFIHHMHQLRFVLSDCWTSNNYWWKTPIPEVSRAIDTWSCSCGSDHRLASDHYMTSLKSKILFLSILDAEL